MPGTSGKQWEEALLHYLFRPLGFPGLSLSNAFGNQWVELAMNQAEFAEIKQSGHLLLPQEELLRVRAHLRRRARAHVLRDGLDVLPAVAVDRLHEEPVLLGRPVARLLRGLVVAPTLPVPLHHGNFGAQAVDLGKQVFARGELGVVLADQLPTTLGEGSWM